MSNPLDRYRKPAADTTDHASDEEDGYVAFHASPKPRRLAIRCRKEAHRAPGYGYLIDIMWDAEDGREVALVFSHAVVMIKGRNLQSMAKQLVAEKIDWIQEFDPNRWGKPETADSPIIESIEYTTRVISPLEREGKEKDKDKQISR